MTMTFQLTANLLASAKLLFACCGLLVLPSCAHKPVGPSYYGKLAYPVTELQLKAGLKLKHVAGAPCANDDERRPEVGTSDGSRTCSVYELIDESGRKLCECPSGLSDPKYAGEFEDYYRQNDQITVRQSTSGNSVLIIEDRSPTFPRIALLLLTKNAQGAWQSRELLAPHVRGSPPNIYGYYASVIDIDDSTIRFSTGEKQWSEKIAKVTKPESSNLKL
jgi:hypothetical protein